MEINELIKGVQHYWNTKDDVLSILENNENYFVTLENSNGYDNVVFKINKAKNTIQVVGYDEELLKEFDTAKEIYRKNDFDEDSEEDFE